MEEITDAFASPNFALSQNWIIRGFLWGLGFEAVGREGKDGFPAALVFYFTSIFLFPQWYI